MRFEKASQSIRFDAYGGSSSQTPYAAQRSSSFRLELFNTPKLMKMDWIHYWPFEC